MATKVAPLLCRTTLNYFPRTGSGAGATEVAILDGRAADLPGWKTCGFELLEHSSRVRDWHNDDDIKAVHYPEIRALAQQLSGADAVLLSSHIKRGPEQAAQHRDLAPITLVHCDFADSYGPQIRERYRRPGPDEADALAAAGIAGKDAAAAERMVILQFWRNLGAAKMDMPIAFCDSRTVPRSQIRPFPVSNYAGGGVNFDALGFSAPKHADDHLWYAFDRMQVDEVVAFRTFDTDMVDSGEAYWTPHSAFRDPEVPLGKPSRSSIELRATCLFL